ncbi:endonuclease/exonuclease/phosphatase family protein [Pedobacter glucosidilyticus]|uniref:endonuclease/exonuclease/phosphatase family protein n=1 Tax=Pedobacter glucosidilyticus TaxID=1122941 RepID=UPI00047BB0D4|nr:endonuclease/exonuclease/phosphatase family protein [Pedobacter glucosidilyticus]
MKKLIYTILILLFTTKLIAQEKGIVLKVLSFNIHHANPPADEKSGKIDLNAITEVIKLVDADLIALQEVDENTKRSGKGNQAKLIAQKLDLKVYFAKAIDFDGGAYGIAILSKYPISKHTIYRLTNQADTSAEPRIMQTVKVKLPGKKYIRFANTHLDFLETGNRELQAKQIVNIVNQEKLPLILAGDWNAALPSKTLDIMDSALTRTCTNCPATFSDENSLAIDFIAYHKKSSFKVKNHVVLNQVTASDHYPIWAELLVF